MPPELSATMSIITQDGGCSWERGGFRSEVTRNSAPATAIGTFLSEKQSFAVLILWYLGIDLLPQHKLNRFSSRTQKWEAAITENLKFVTLAQWPDNGQWINFTEIYQRQSMSWMTKYLKNCQIFEKFCQSRQIIVPKKHAYLGRVSKTNR